MTHRLLTHHSQLNELLTASSPERHVSIYLPTQPNSSSETINEDATRLKSLIATIKKDVGDQLFEQLEKLVADQSFWRDQGYGLAIFANSKQIISYRLPLEVTSQAFVSDKFIVSPLLALQALVDERYLLEVNLKQPQLYHAVNLSVSLCEDADLPGDLKDTLQIDEFQRTQQFHTGEGKGRAMFHGHGGADDQKDNDTDAYLDFLAKKADAYLKDKQAPLLLAGTKTRTTALRKKMTYKFVANDEITGNFDAPQPEQALSSELQKITRSTIDQQLLEIKEAFESAYGNEIAVVGKTAIEQAASMDNVKTLLLPMLRKTNDSVRQNAGNNYLFELTDDLTSMENTVRACHKVKAEVLPVSVNDTTPHNDPVAICRYKIDAATK